MNMKNWLIPDVNLKNIKDILNSKKFLQAISIILLGTIGLFSMSKQFNLSMANIKAETLQEFRAQAIEAGVAKWVITNELTGAAAFVWKEQK